MSHHVLDIRTKLGLQTEGVDDGMLVRGQHAFRIQQLCVLLLLSYIADGTAEVMSLGNLCHHGVSGL